MRHRLGPRKLPTPAKNPCASGIHSWTEPKPATRLDTEKCVTGIAFTMRRECRTCGQLDLWLTAATPRQTFQPRAKRAV